MNFKKETDSFRRKMDEYDKVKHICSCGHRIIMPKWVDKQICGWCGNYVFKDKREEFKYRLKEEIRKGGKK